MRFLQDIDKMIEYLLKQLSGNEQEGKNVFSICVTGDHSTPVLSGTVSQIL